MESAATAEPTQTSPLRNSDSAGHAGHILEAGMDKSCWGGSRDGGGTRKPSGKEMKMQKAGNEAKDIWVGPGRDCLTCLHLELS